MAEASMAEKSSWSSHQYNVYLLKQTYLFLLFLLLLLFFFFVVVFFFLLLFFLLLFVVPLHLVFYLLAFATLLSRSGRIGTATYHILRNIDPSNGSKRTLFPWQSQPQLTLTETETEIFFCWVGSK